jgi:tetratricopeptide (TPR) repeat protein
VVIEGEIVPPWDDSFVTPDLRSAELVLVPGPARARALEPHVGAVVACGLPSLDRLLEDPALAREEARLALGLPLEGRLLLLYPGADPECSALAQMGDGILALAALGASLCVVGPETAGPWISGLRDLAAHLPALHVLDSPAPELCLAAADGLVGDPGSLTLAGLALGLSTLLVEGAGRPAPVLDGLGKSVPCANRLETLIRVAAESLGGSLAPQSEGVGDLLLRDGSSAARAAEAILARAAASATRSSAGSDATPPEPQLFAELEAQIGFGETDGPIWRLESYLHQSPSPRGYRLLASFYRKADRSDQARAAATRSERLAREELARSLCERGRVAVDAGAREEARTAFAEAQTQAPEHADPWIGLGSLELASQAHGEAVQAFREATRSDPRSARAWSGLGLALLSEQKPEDALEALEQALDLQPDLLPAIFGVVHAAFQTGEIERGERRVRACLDLRPGNVDLAFTLAGLRLQLGNFAGALEMVERVELFRPDYPGLADLRAKLARP